MKQIELRSTLLGQIPTLIINGIGIVIVYFLLRSMHATVTDWWINQPYGDEGYWKYLLGIHGPDEKLFYALGIIIATCAIVIWSISLLATIIYRSTTRIILTLGEGDKVVSVIHEEMSFIWSKSSSESPCNRILSLEVTHPTLGNLTNTGAITVSFASFANADSAKQIWCAYGVIAPDALVKQIAEAVPNYEGIKISKDK